ncbi:MAG: hypothetical protein GX548_00820 [Lentisphaerae bacterium]|nr:hypothetical protein [Lentisphaerota bacterium]
MRQPATLRPPITRPPITAFDGDPISSFAYTYDAIGRRTQRVDGRANPPDEPLAVTNTFAYNQRSELINAVMPALIPAGTMTATC